MKKHIQITIRGVNTNTGNRFKTFVAAKQLGLSGMVYEDRESLIIEAEGDEENLAKIISYLEQKYVGISSTKIKVTEKPVMFYDEFLIL